MKQLSCLINNMTELGTMLGNSMKDQKNLSSTQGLNPSAISSYFVFSDYRFKIKVTRVLVEQQSIDPDALVWGLRNWGEKEWADEATALLPFEAIQDKILTQSLPDIAREEIIKWLVTDTAKAPEYILVGTGSTAYSPSDTSLDNEIARKVVVADIGTSFVAKYILELTGADSEFQGQTLREIGLGTDSTENPSDILYTRVIIDDVVLVDEDNYRLTIEHSYEDLSFGDSIIPDAGLNKIREWVATETGVAPTHAAWGTGTTALSTSDTTLEGEQQRNSIASIINSGFTATFESILDKTQANGTDITKSGIFNDATTGTLFAESLFGAINKTSLFQIFQTDRITIV